MNILQLEEEKTQINMVAKYLPKFASKNAYTNEQAKDLL